MVDRALAQTRQRARALVLAGVVLVDERVIDKAGALVDNEAKIRLVPGPQFVSRGGIKLDHALRELDIDVSSMVVTDIGASTGGFTDCLLKHGATRVYAIDVGYGQLDYRLRQDPRVVVMERVNARYPFHIPERLDLATLDLSFISLEKVIPTVSMLLKEGGWLIPLIKPQFEAGRGEVGRGGVVRDPLLHARVLGRFISWAIEHGFRLRGLVPSPILGADGNREFFALLRLA